MALQSSLKLGETNLYNTISIEYHRIMGSNQEVTGNSHANMGYSQRFRGLRPTTVGIELKTVAQPVWKQKTQLLFESNCDQTKIEQISRNKSFTPNCKLAPLPVTGCQQCTNIFRNILPSGKHGNGKSSKFSPFPPFPRLMTTFNTVESDVVHQSLSPVTFRVQGATVASASRCPKTA